MTNKQVIEACRRYGCSARKIDGEWKIRDKRTGATYFTDCPEDAVGTAKAMTAHRHTVRGNDLRDFDVAVRLEADVLLYDSEGNSEHIGGYPGEHLFDRVLAFGRHLIAVEG